MNRNDLSSLTEEKITARLEAGRTGMVRSRFPEGLVFKDLRPAAVIIPFLRIQDFWHLLFIRRTKKRHDPHSGQVAFPGGASDPEDISLQATALREMREEIGVNPDKVTLLGRLDDFMTISSFMVAPFVGRIPWPYQLKLQQDEVSHAFTIPLEWLADPANHRLQWRHLPPPYDPIPVVYFEPYDGEILWGVSAGFTLALINALRSVD